MREIVAETLELLEQGQDFALIKLVAEKGSTPRAAGAEMLLRRDGSIAGTIGGGLLEATMMRAARQALEEKRSLVTSLSLTGTDVRSAEKMICGGAADVLITYVPAGDPGLTDICRAVRAAVESRRRAWLFTVLPEGDDAAVRCVLGEDGAIVGPAVCDATTLHAAVGAAVRHGSAALPDGRHVLVEPLEAQSTVVICGAGHVALALAPAAAAAGFDVLVLDDREDFADPERFPGASVVLTGFDGALSRVDVDEQSYVVIVTRGHTHDTTVLEQALRTPARYIGLMASRTKRQRIFTALLEEGFREDDLARVHSPIGIEIGAETPAELAVSIVAEMIKVRSGAGG
jgi:xanthine dehydrogenase accessory factor